MLLRLAFLVGCVLISNPVLGQESSDLSRWPDVAISELKENCARAIVEGVRRNYLAGDSEAEPAKAGKDFSLIASIVREQVLRSVCSCVSREISARIPYNSTLSDSGKTEKLLVELTAPSAKCFPNMAQMKEELRKAEAKAADDSYLRFAMSRDRGELQAFCTEAANRPYLAKAACEPRAVTTEQLTDTSRIAKEEIPAVVRAKESIDFRMAAFATAERDFDGRRGIDFAAITEQGIVAADGNLLRLRAGEITWGEFNRARLALNEALNRAYVFVSHEW